MDISIQQIARDPVEAEAEAAAARRSEGAGCLPGRVAYRRWLALTSSPGARADEEKKCSPANGRDALKPKSLSMNNICYNSVQQTSHAPSGLMRITGRTR